MPVSNSSFRDVPTPREMVQRLARQEWAVPLEGARDRLRKSTGALRQTEKTLIPLFLMGYN
jgi:hypothetical protein